MVAMQSLAVGLLVFVLSVTAAIIKPFNCANTVCDIIDIHWPSSSMAIMVTEDFKVWRSTDEGMNWVQILKQVDWIIPSQNSTVIYFVGSYGTGSSTALNYTLDYGQTILASSLPLGKKQIEYVEPHPTQLGWILVTGCTNLQSHANCSLYYTKNFGKTWQISLVGTLNSGVAAWGNSTSEPDLVFVWKKDWSYGYTSDYGTSVTTIFPDTLGFVRTRHYQFVGVADVGNAMLYVSSASVDTTHKTVSNYRKASFPFGDEIPQDQYSFVDDITWAEFIGVHQRGNNPYGAIYSSEQQGRTYQLSLDYVFTVNTEYDFHRFRGLGGIYVANEVRNYETNQQPELTTRITFDNGANWHHLTPPPSINNCTGCHLHLLGNTGSTFQGLSSWRTHDNAIGLIVANGNVGEYLGDGKTPFATFFSRNAGLNWTQIYPGPSVFEFGDHGGILVIAPSFVPVNFIMYSFDEGLTFQQANFSSSTPMYVFNIYTEPNGTGQRFILTGELNGTNYIYSIDLSDVRPNICQPSDYENWSPSNGFAGNGTMCFMGANTVYQRRKQTSVCYNNMNTDHVVSQIPCQCSWVDYECEFNYQTGRRNNTGGFHCDRLSPDPACISGEKYNLPTGYTLVPGTMCQGGVNLLGPLTSCSSGGSHPTEVAAAIIVTIVIVSSIVLIGVLYWKNDRFHNWVKSFSSKSTGQKYKEINNTGDDDNDNTPFLSGN